MVNNNLEKMKNFEEKVFLVSCASIGYNSTRYWNENSEKWTNFFGKGITPEMVSSKKKYPWNQVASADVSGVVTGGVGGCIWGAVGGSVTFPVVGTLVGCAGV